MKNRARHLLPETETRGTVELVEGFTEYHLPLENYDHAFMFETISIEGKAVLRFISTLNSHPKVGFCRGQFPFRAPARGKGREPQSADISREGIDNFIPTCDEGYSGNCTVRPTI
jgi:hypothetical protein